MFYTVYIDSLWCSFVLKINVQRPTSTFLAFAGYLNGGGGGGGPISSASAALLSPNRNCGGGIGRSTDDYISLPQATSPAASAGITRWIFIYLLPFRLNSL